MDLLPFHVSASVPSTQTVWNKAKEDIEKESFFFCITTGFDHNDKTGDVFSPQTLMNKVHVTIPRDTKGFEHNGKNILNTV